MKQRQLAQAAPGAARWQGRQTILDHEPRQETRFRGRATISPGKGIRT